jgi:hypothetical protein
MKTLIIKLNAAGDVVRTTSLLRRLPGEVTWLTASLNMSLLEGISDRLQCVSWEGRKEVLDSSYDLIVNLEDEAEVADFVRKVAHTRVFGAYMDVDGRVQYTRDAGAWFDLGLISLHGKQEADRLKFLNRRSYQELIFEGLGYMFENDAYLLPRGTANERCWGDVGIAPVAGPVWPMKGWDHYDALQRELEAAGLRVNVLPRRRTLLEHIGDVRSHRCLVSGDSLPMHLALGAGRRCVTLFNCTSPWEIHDYGLQTKIVSPLLPEFFYKRGDDGRARSAVALREVLDAVFATLGADKHMDLVTQ